MSRAPHRRPRPWRPVGRRVLPRGLARALGPAATRPVTRGIARTVTRTVAAVAVLGLLLASGACGVRFESDPPAARVPGVDEQVRATTVADALAVRDLARRTLDETAPTAAVRDVLEHVVSAAEVQVDALGGVYDGPAPTRTPAGTPADTLAATPATTARPATAAGVVAQLAANEKAARARLEQPDDGGLARLVAQVAASDDVAARALAQAAKIRVPSPAAKIPAKVPATVPAGARATTLQVVVASEDAAGYTLEVEAARARGAARTKLVARAAVHRARAQSWALTTGLAGTDGDPRTSAYAPVAGSAAKVSRTLENGLAARYAEALDTASAGSRTALADLLTDCTRAAVDAGAALPALPGGKPAADATRTPAPTRTTATTTTGH